MVLIRWPVYAGMALLLLLAVGARAAGIDLDALSVDDIAALPAAVAAAASRAEPL